MPEHVWGWHDLTLRYFSPREFDHPDKMSREFLLILDEWRGRCGFPVRVLDDARTSAEHEYLYRQQIAAGKRPPNSAHLRGRAVDCRPVEPSEEREMLMAYHALDMWYHGTWPWLGLEVATAHLHLDSDPVLVAEKRRPHLWSGASR